jgi:O-antigen/teichoic acid export membrane protein
MSKPAITIAEVGSETATKPTEAPFGQFVSRVALTFGTRVLMLAGLLGSSIVATHWLGPEGFGTLAVLNATVALTLQIASAGLPSANTYFIARDRRNLGPVWANSIMFALVVGSLAALVIFALGKLKPSLFGAAPTNLLGIAAISIPFQLLILVGLNVLLAVDRIGQMNLLECLSPAFSLLNATVALVILGAGLTTLVAFNTAAAVVVSFFLLAAVGKVLQTQDDRRAARPDLSLLQTMLQYAIKFYISIMAGFVIFRADLLIVNYFRGPAEAGVYAVASQVSFLLLMLPGVIATLLFPRVASQPDPRAEFAVQVTRNASFMMLLICLAAAAGSFALPLVYGARFADATTQLLILLPGVYLVGLESVLVQHFTGTDLPAAIPGFWMVTVLANLALNLALVPAFGARAAALNSTLSYALIFVLVAWYFCRKTGRRPGEIFLPRAGDMRQLFARVRLALATGQNRLR